MDECFVAITRHENRISIKTTSNKVCCRSQVIYPHNSFADWELWLIAITQHQESFIPLTGRLEKVQNSKYGYTDGKSLSNHPNVKKLLVTALQVGGYLYFLSIWFFSRRYEAVLWRRVYLPLKPREIKAEAQRRNESRTIPALVFY